MRPEEKEPGPLAGLDTPLPPTDLRQRTLAVVRESLGREQVSDGWSHLWFSRPLRVAWMVSMAACVAGHLAVTLASKTDSSPGSTMIVSADVLGDEELQEIIDLPRVDQSVLGDTVFINDRIDNRHQRGHES